MTAASLPICVTFKKLSTRRLYYLQNSKALSYPPTPTPRPCRRRSRSITELIIAGRHQSKSPASFGPQPLVRLHKPGHWWPHHGSPLRKSSVLCKVLQRAASAPHPHLAGLRGRQSLRAALDCGTSS